MTCAGGLRAARYSMGARMSSDLDWPPDPLRIDFDSGEWITLQQAAAVARVSEKTVRDWVRTRDVAVFLPSGRYLISRRRLFRTEPPQTS